MTGISLYRVA